MVFRDANDVVAVSGEAAVALAVLAEGALGAVGSEAVELGDEAGVGPEAIDLVTVFLDGDPGIETRTRKTMGIEEREEQFLEGASNPSSGVLPQAFEADADGGRPSMVRVTIEEGRERDRPVDPEVFHLPERALRRRLALFGCEVEDGPSRGRHRYPVADRNLIALQTPVVPADRPL
ncbi:MAG TPA: hypothetical protein VMH33_03005 [Solirubrobacterales bacterium]|nr:hypothetical protein [Solirubrobacterales bacterium]